MSNTMQGGDLGGSQPIVHEVGPITSQETDTPAPDRPATSFEIFFLPIDIRLEVFEHVNEIFGEEWNTKYIVPNAKYQPCAGFDDLTDYYNQVSVFDYFDESPRLLCTLDEFRDIDPNVQVEFDAVRFPIKKIYNLANVEEAYAFVLWVAEQTPQIARRIRDVKVHNQIQFTRSVQDFTTVQDWMLAALQPQADFLRALSHAPGLEKVAIDLELCCVEVGQAKKELLEAIKVEMEQAFGRNLVGGLIVRVRGSHLLATTFHGW